MWTRAQLKDNAKAALRGRYWVAFLVCLVTSLLTGGVSSSVTSSGNDLQLSTTQSSPCLLYTSDAADD